MVVDSAYDDGKTVCTYNGRNGPETRALHLGYILQNNAVDVIAAKIPQLGSPHIRPARFVSKKVIADIKRFVHMTSRTCSRKCTSSMQISIPYLTSIL
ncbi:hypothetical protein Aduo_006182 [Ancylostoma duodenale]